MISQEFRLTFYLSFFECICPCGIQHLHSHYCSFVVLDKRHVSYSPKHLSCAFVLPVTASSQLAVNSSPWHFHSVSMKTVCRQIDVHIWLCRNPKESRRCSDWQTETAFLHVPWNYTSVWSWYSSLTVLLCRKCLSQSKQVTGSTRYWKYLLISVCFLHRFYDISETEWWIIICVNVSVLKMNRFDCV